MRVQFVVGLHSVPYLFNSNFYQLTLRASNDRVLFFFALVSAPASLVRAGGGMAGGGEGSEEAQTPALCDYTARLHGEAARCGRVAWLRCVPAVLLRRIVSGVLSTGVIHSVENLHACDLAERS